MEGIEHVRHQRRLAEFAGRVFTRVMAISHMRMMQRIPRPGLVSWLFRLFRVSDGWDYEPVLAPTRMIELCDLAWHVRPESIPLDTKRAATEFVDTDGDPPWIELEEGAYNGAPNSTRNTHARLQNEARGLLQEEQAASTNERRVH